MIIYCIKSNNCIPCRMMEPVIKDLQKRYPEIDWRVQSIEESEEICNKYFIRRVPTFVIENNENKKLNLWSGFTTTEKFTEEINKWKI